MSHEIRPKSFGTFEKQAVGVKSKKIELLKMTIDFTSLHFREILGLFTFLVSTL